MIESTVVNKWQTMARIDEAVTLLITVLDDKFGKVPPEVEATIRNSSDLTKLQTWVIQAAKVTTLDEFRTTAGL